MQKTFIRKSQGAFIPRNLINLHKSLHKYPQRRKTSRNPSQVCPTASGEKRKWSISESGFDLGFHTAYFVGCVRQACNHAIDK